MANSNQRKFASVPHVDGVKLEATRQGGEGAAIVPKQMWEIYSKRMHADTLQAQPELARVAIFSVLAQYHGPSHALFGTKIQRFVTVHALRQEVLSGGNGGNGVEPRLGDAPEGELVNVYLQGSVGAGAGDAGLNAPELDQDMVATHKD